MFPKHTLLQKRTLAIQVLTAMLSLLMRPELWCESPTAFGAGEGTMFGLMSKAIAVPAIPIMVDSTNPGFERSTEYHITGLTRASVSDA